MTQNFFPLPDESAPANSRIHTFLLTFRFLPQRPPVLPTARLQIIADPSPMLPPGLPQSLNHDPDSPRQFPHAIKLPFDHRHVNGNLMDRPVDRHHGFIDLFTNAKECFRSHIFCSQPYVRRRWRLGSTVFRQTAPSRPDVAYPSWSPDLFSWRD